MSLQTTSRFVEYTIVNRCSPQEINEVFEEALGDVVILNVECDINAMLVEAGVMPTSDCSIDMDAVGRFEYILKTQDSPGGLRWSQLTGGTNGNQKLLYKQVRSFLGDFFDHDKELNAIVAQRMSADPRAIVFLDDSKIRNVLENLGTPTGTIGERTFVSLEDTSPINRGCFATCILSVRQIADCLHNFATINPNSAYSRITQDDNGNDVFNLWSGDSIIGECMVFDSDAVSSDKQYKQVIKMQITQS